MDRYWAGSPNYTPGNCGRVALFPHWTAGGFDGSVSTLQNPARQASAHYVIEGGRVAQLVDENDSAWHCGNYYYNMRAIAYEMVGWPGNPPTRETLDTTAELMAEASRRWFGGAPLVLGENVMLHRWVYATSCPGESDIDYLVARANEILRGEEKKEEPEMPTIVSAPKGGGDIHRMFSGARHLWTADADEIAGLASAGWVDEGVAWRSPAYGDAVYRLEKDGDHLLTADYGEAGGCVEGGWKCEAVTMWSGGPREVYRLCRDNRHHFTCDTAERDALVSKGWAFEGVAFMAE